jgi:NAD(P)-dependent dehydrogenase (short-subunit alcohol dehydrogenase family)
MISSTLIANGVRVFAVSRRASQSDADALVARLRGSTSVSEQDSLIAVKANIAVGDGVQEMLLALKAGGVRRIDILVNNSGAVWAEPFELFGDNAWSKVLDLNVKAVFNVTRALLPFLEASGRGRVINIGSIDGIATRGLPHYSYSASKAAVHMLTRTMAAHFARDRRPVTVNAIAAGLFPSDMTKGFISSVGGIDQFESEIPLRRAGGARDIGGAVLWLASPAGAWVTGAIITVDGGQLVKANM